jgi:hypothetical protein
MVIINVNTHLKDININNLKNVINQLAALLCPSLLAVLHFNRCKTPWPAVQVKYLNNCILRADILR